MFKILRNHESRIVAITRMLLGVMLTCHGAQKLLGAFGGTQTRPCRMGRRPHRTPRRSLDGGRPVHPYRLVPDQRPDGLRLLHRPRAPRLLAHPQRWRTRDYVLLAVLFLRRTRPGSLGGRQPPQPRPAGHARAAPSGPVTNPAGRSLARPPAFPDSQSSPTRGGLHVVTESQEIRRGRFAGPGRRRRAGTGSRAHSPDRGPLAGAQPQRPARPCSIQRRGRPPASTTRRACSGPSRTSRSASFAPIPWR